MVRDFGFIVYVDKKPYLMNKQLNIYLFKKKKKDKQPDNNLSHTEMSKT